MNINLSQISSILRNMKGEVISRKYIHFKNLYKKKITYKLKLTLFKEIISLFFLYLIFVN